MKCLFIVFLFVLISQYAYNQNVGDSAKVNNIFYQSEEVFGGRISTNGWGLHFSQSFYNNIHNKTIYEINFNTIHHPKEYKEPSAYYWTKTFVYGKLNDAFDLQAGMGTMFTLFDKRGPKSVAIRLKATAGIDLMFLKPYYYYVIVNIQTGRYEPMTYDPSIQASYIIQKAPFAMGLNEIKVDPGLYFKLGTSFEHSKIALGVSELELGIELRMFLYEPQIMAEISNPQFITSLFMQYNIGKMIKNKVRKHKLNKKL